MIDKSELRKLQAKEEPKKKRKKQNKEHKKYLRCYDCKEVSQNKPETGYFVGFGKGVEYMCKKRKETVFSCDYACPEVETWHNNPLDKKLKEN